MTYALRPFQAEDLPFYVSHPKAPIWYEPRLGKTVVTCKVLAKTLPRVTLVLCPKNAVFVWQDHLTEIFAEEAPDVKLEVHYVRGDKTERLLLWDKAKAAGNRADHVATICTVFIVSWNAFFYDQDYMIRNKIQFVAIVADEYQKFLKKRTNQAFAKIKPLVKSAHRFHPLSGTPAGRGQPQQFWPILHLCDPAEFKSYWDFVQEHCDLGTDFAGHQHVVGVKNGPKFRALLEQYGRIRLRKDVAPQMPRIQRSLLHVEMTKPQRGAYEAMLRDNYFWAKEDKGSLVVAATSMEVVLRARQLLVCPAMLDPALGVGGAIEHFADTMEEADEEDKLGRHAVVFTPFTKALPHFEHYLKDRGLPVVGSLQGGLEPEELKGRIINFKMSKGIILCSILYAQAFSLAGPEQSYFVGYEWNPDDNQQAEDRLIPQEGFNPILTWYYSYRSTVDEMLAESVTIKQTGINAMFGSKK